MADKIVGIIKLIKYPRVQSNNNNLEFFAFWVMSGQKKYVTVEERELAVK